MSARWAAAIAMTALVACTPKASAHAHVKLVDAPATGDVAAIVKRELGAAQAEGRRVLVYVGATWCEPCRRFHQAAARGELDSLLGNVELLVFDLDRDGKRLDDAGYASRLIPLLCVPGPDGRGTALRMEGSIKGPGAVAQMTPRLKALLSSPWSSSSSPSSGR